MESTMKNLAISNIAWDSTEDVAIGNLMGEIGIPGVEIAPTKIWPNPLEASDAEIRDYRRFWEDRDIQIVAMQALLYGRPDLTIFQSADKRGKTLEYLGSIMRLGGMLGANALIFGSPTNRQVDNLSTDEIDDIAVSFFGLAGEMAQEHGVTLCIEPNPAQYACDFIQTSAQGLELVRKVNSPGFGLHLDAAGMTLSQENLEQAVESCAGSIRHFHVSEPFLGPVGKQEVDHSTIASTLERIVYPNWISVEMRHDPQVDSVIELGRALEFLKETYGD